MDATFGQYPAFSVETSDEDNDVALYLQSVRREAEEDSCVHFVERHEVEATKENSDIDKAIDSKISTTESHPLDQWSEDLLTRFESLKQQLQTLQTEIHSSVPSDFEVPDTANQWRKFVFEHEPPSIVYFYKNIERATVIKLLVYFTKWLTLSSSAVLSRWIWIALIRIDNLLDPNECSVIRDLAKKASKLSSKDVDNATPASKYTINMILVLVRNYYGQRDLLDAKYL
ncbi:predicted protein [Scheffersomyces stipitis CBS 6054]|uniref:Gem-associated protein 2 n=1 Tax=Scheffersomyces stipitis (strain ATCC 58785 / CBS 6054 / NBRC 10063 / NRRL Y-11545) TaxID=322104 RepID=A3LUZ7_PICST|nr:predicted protein [Scheffersomyces stipitis CBS 6054]ABN66682.1 predicted protein [Scheffersomyces stipitis CBS 6054]